ncbi:MAG: vWA domain-containing protein [Silvanigrellaceae bacterium]
MVTKYISLILLMNFATSCGESSYISGGPDNSGGKNVSADAEGAGKNGKASAAPEAIGNKIAAPGQSLDLYAIVDISGSLGKTDPNCTRFEALKTFFKELKTTLGENTDARLTLTVFSSQARFVGTDEGFLKFSDAEIDAKYRPSICVSSGSTNISRAFALTKDAAVGLMKTSPKKVSSVLVFSDGMPTDMPLPIDAAAQLRSVFPDRVFGVLLGEVNVSGSPTSGGVITVGGITVVTGPTTGTGSVTASPEAFMNQVTDSPDRVRRVNKATDLASALSSFLK